MRSNNPLFPQPDDETGKSAQPSQSAAEPAVELVRQKIEQLYAKEPDAKDEIDEAEASKKRSRHQKFMYRLSTSGNSLAEIQTEWHNYYTRLSDKEKHEVWQEFYETNAGQSRYALAAPQAGKAKGKSLEHPAAKRSANLGKRRVGPRVRGDIRKQILDRVSGGGKIKAKHHFHSLLFGLGMGFLALFILLFGFFNEFIIAPFIQPGQNAGATPLIISPNAVSSDKKDEIIIPKINVEIPVNYSQTSTDETAIENDLEDGVVHYPTTVMPGQLGNAAFFGHSSNNIFNPGHYKFAFVLLHTLVPGDAFYLIKDHKVYVYKVISRKIVDPSDVSVLNNIPGQKATATLITCDPPGTSIHRLIVVGQQVSPSVTGNTKPAQTQSTAAPTQLPGNGPSLWSRLIHSVF